MSSPYFLRAFALCAALSFLPLWVGPYLPMVDLPQHAAQISIINNLHSPAYGFSHQLQLDWFVPYAFEYFLAAQLAKIVGIFMSLQMAVSLAVLALPCAIYFLLKQTGGDPWWSLVGFPLSYGFSFYWGFLSYIVSVPVGIFFVAMVYRYSRNPSLRSAVWVSLLGFLVLYSHAITYAVCGLTAFFISLTSRKKIAAMVPLFIPIPFLLIWFFSPEHAVPKVKSFVQWGSHDWNRIESAVLNLMSNSGALGAALAALGLILFVIIGARFKPFKLRYYFPFVLAWLLYFFVPHHAMDISFIYQRLAIFIPIFFLPCLSPSLSGVKLTLSRAGLLILVVFWMGMLTFQFKGFNMEAKDFDFVIGSLEPNKKTLGVIFDNGGAYPFAGVFGHFPAYYQALKGGEYTFSFAESFKSVARYKRGYKPLPFFIGYDLTVPGRLSSATVRRYDYFIVRSIQDKFPAMKTSFEEDYSLAASKGPWWVYKKNEVSQ